MDSIEAVELEIASKASLRTAEVVDKATSVVDLRKHVWNSHSHSKETKCTCEYCELEAEIIRLRQQVKFWDDLRHSDNGETLRMRPSQIRTIQDKLHSLRRRQRQLLMLGKENQL